MDKVLKFKKKRQWKFKIADIIQGYTKKMFPPYVWMPSVHTQHKESKLCQIKGVSICPHMFECPQMLRCPNMFGCLLYVLMPPYLYMF